MQFRYRGSIAYRDTLDGISLSWFQFKISHNTSSDAVDESQSA